MPSQNWPPQNSTLTGEFCPTMLCSAVVGRGVEVKGEVSQGRPGQGWGRGRGKAMRSRAFVFTVGGGVKA